MKILCFFVAFLISKSSTAFAICLNHRLNSEENIFNHLIIYNNSDDTITYSSIKYIAGDYDSLLVIRAFLSVALSENKSFKMFSVANTGDIEDFIQIIGTKSKTYYLSYFDSLLTKSKQYNRLEVINRVHYWCLNYLSLLSISKFVETYNTNYNLATLIAAVPELKFLLKKYIGKNQYWGSVDSENLSYLFYDLVNFLSSLNFKQQLRLNYILIHSIYNLN